MYHTGRWADRQLSKMELIAVVIVVSLLFSAVTRHMLRFFAVAEQSLMATSIVNINTGLQYRAAVHLLNGETAALQVMSEQNPFSILSESLNFNAVDAGEALPESRRFLVDAYQSRLPSNYRGELLHVEPSEIEGGNWYYDLSRRRLVYRVDNDEYFESELSGAPRVEFEVRVVYDDVDFNGRFDAGIDHYQQLELQTTHYYSWRL